MDSRYPAREPSGTGSGGSLFFGNNFTFASASASSNESPGGRRLPRTAVPLEPQGGEVRRPSAARYMGGDAGLTNGGLGLAGGLAAENTAWMRWSRERRASIARRQQREARDTATLAAIRESTRHGGHQPLVDPMPPPPASPMKPLPPLPPPPATRRQQMPARQPRGRRGKGRSAIGLQPDLTMAEWKRLLAFWQHPVFVRARVAAMVMLGMSLITGIIAVSCRGWSNHLMADNATSAFSGLWDTCFVSNGSCVSAFNLPTTNGDASDWQKSSAALLVSSVLLSAIGCLVAMCGFWASYLPRKIYYYHSSGEIFFLSGVIASIGVGVYPYSMLRFQLIQVRYNYGYGLGWVTAGLQYLAAFAMMLDFLVRESSRPRPWIDAFARRCCCCFYGGDVGGGGGIGSGRRGPMTA